MSAGSGSSGGAGQGYRVEVDNLRAFATKLRSLLHEFEQGANGTRLHGQAGVAQHAFGTFDEAEQLHVKYEAMRNGLRDMLNGVYDAIDLAQRRAELTATNYDEQEHETVHRLGVNKTDGWSVGTMAPVEASRPVVYGAAAAPQVTPASQSKPAPAPSTADGQPRPAW